jgi:hypothetical protein
LNLRPPRPERSSLPIALCKSTTSSAFIEVLFRLRSRVPGPTWAHSEGVLRLLQVIGMMVPVDALKRLYGHAEILCSLPGVDAALHQPCRSCVAQSVRRYVVAEARRTPRSCPGPPQLDHRLALVVGDMLDPKLAVGLTPSPQVWQKPRRALSEQNSKYLERPSNRSDRPGKMQENQWPRNPVLTLWQSKRICSDNAPPVLSITEKRTNGRRRPTK